jgi:cysteine desulfurase
MTTEGPIYLDYQATTPVDPRVMQQMVPWFDEFFGNAASIQHSHGQEAEAAVEVARGKVAALLNADPREIVFTSGATESNNLAIKGALGFHLKHHGRAHVITCATEHKCVLESVAAMEAQGATATILPVAADGLIDLAALESALTDETVLVTIMAANNEIGVLQPIDEIGALCRARGVWFHTDAAQAVAKVPVDVEASKIDLLSISGHKIYGPKGVGVLYVRRRPRVRLEPLFSGGGQERGLRSGTLPVPLCIGLGAACDVAAYDLEEEGARAARLRDRFLAHIAADIPDVIVNGSMERRLPGNLNMSFPEVDGTRLLESLTQVSVSSGSACMSDDVEPSYVLRAIGLPDAVAAASVRLCIGRPTTESDVDMAAAHLVDVVRNLRRGSSIAAE